MNSFYNFSGNVRRNWGLFNFSAGGGRQDRVDPTGGRDKQQREIQRRASATAQWVTANGSYSKANGQALATGAGLVPIPVPPPVVPSNLVSLYGGNSYSLRAVQHSREEAHSFRHVLPNRSTARTDQIRTSRITNQSNHNVSCSISTASCTSPADIARLEQGFSQSRHPATSYSSYYMGSRGGSTSSKQAEPLPGAALVVAAAGLLLSAAWPAGKSQAPRPRRELWEMSLDGGRKLSWERSFKSEVGGQAQPRLLEQSGRCDRRRSGIPLPGAAVQHRDRFARTHHRDRSRRGRACTSSTSPSASTSSSQRRGKARTPCARRSASPSMPRTISMSPTRRPARSSSSSPAESICAPSAA